MFFSFDNKRKKIQNKIANDPNTTFAIKDVFVDQNLAQCVADKIGKTPKDKNVTLNDLNMITTLNASSKEITDLDGIEYLNNLTTANFSNNKLLKLPDYSNPTPNLYQNKDSLVYVNFTDNPFLDENRLFSLEASENRRKFFNQFLDPSVRFDLGSKKEKVFGNTEVNPSLIRLAFERLLPRSEQMNREEILNDLLLDFIAAKKVFFNEDVYKGQYIFNNGKAQFKTEFINPAYLGHERIKVAGDLIEHLLSEKDLYLIRSLIKMQSEKRIQRPQSTKSLEDLIAYYTWDPERLSTDYIKTDKGFQEKLDYSTLKASGISSEEEHMINAIENEQVRSNYLKYLEYHDILEQYQKEHPDRMTNIAKLLRNSDDFITNFLNQYLALQNNMMLSDQQRASLQQAGPSIEKFVNNFVDQARSFFDQDIFGLEVEMKYVDMLAEADKKFNS